MREFLAKLLDEENRQADLASFGQIVSLVVAVLFSVAIYATVIIVAIKTGKIDPMALWVLGIWVSAGLGYGVADKKWGGVNAPAAPSPPQPVPSPSQSSSIPSPKPVDPPKSDIPPTHQRTIQ